MKNYMKNEQFKMPNEQCTKHIVLSDGFGGPQKMRCLDGNAFFIALYSISDLGKG